MKLTWHCNCGIVNCEGVAEVCDFWNSDTGSYGFKADLCIVPRVWKCTNYIKCTEATGDPEHGLDFVEVETYEGVTHKVCSDCETNGNLTKLLNYKKNVGFGNKDELNADFFEEVWEREVSRLKREGSNRFPTKKSFRDKARG